MRKILIIIIILFYPLSLLQADTVEQKFQYYVSMMKDDKQKLNFYKGVQKIMRSPRRFIPYLEQNMQNTDSQIVFGCVFILSNIPDYTGNPLFYKRLVENLQNDQRSWDTIYLCNAYESAIWLKEHYQLARNEIIQGLESEDIQQLAFLSLIIEANESSYDFQPHFTSQKLKKLALHLNNDNIPHNATYATILFLLIGQQFPEELEQINQEKIFDRQGRKLFAYIRKSIANNDRSFEWGELELHRANELGWDGKKRNHYNLSGDIYRGYMSPFNNE